MQRGCVIVCVHYATGLVYKDVKPDGDHPLLRWLGGYFANRSCAHHESFARIFPAATITPAAPQHPAWRGCRKFTVHDEPCTNNYFGSHKNKPAGNVTVLATSIPQLVGGDRAKGELLFKGVCAVCHAMGEAGGRAGPDLSNLICRVYGSVFNDIANPNDTINPDHVAFNITLKDGGTIVGVVIEDQQDKLLLAGLGGPSITVKKADIAEMKTSPVSLMPPGLDKALGEQGMKDLMTYLLLPAP